MPWWQNSVSNICIRNDFGNSGALNSFWPSDTSLWNKSRSTLTQVMVYCLMSPSHYLNQCWLLIGEFLWYSPENNFTVNAWATVPYNSCHWVSKLYFWNYCHIFLWPSSQLTPGQSVLSLLMIWHQGWKLWWNFIKIQFFYILKRYLKIFYFMSSHICWGLNVLTHQNLHMYNCQLKIPSNL